MALSIVVTVRYRNDRGEQTSAAKVTFDTLAPLTPDDAKDKSFGSWRCTDVLIGKHNNGKYYVANLYPARVKSRRYVPRQANVNPVAHLFDSEWEDPFLFLQNFGPMTVGSREMSYASGIGLLWHVAPGEISVNNEVHWRLAEDSPNKKPPQRMENKWDEYVRG